MSEFQDLQRLYEESIKEIEESGVRLIHRPYAIYFYDSTGAFGCGTGSGDIFIDRSLYMLQSDVQNKDTIIHEICHINTGGHNGKHGHGKLWREMCEKVRQKHPEYPLKKRGDIDWRIYDKVKELRMRLHIEDPLPEMEYGFYPEGSLK